MKKLTYDFGNLLRELPESLSNIISTISSDKTDMINGDIKTIMYIKFHLNGMYGTIALTSLNEIMYYVTGHQICHINLTSFDEDIAIVIDYFMSNYGFKKQ